jgi:hypothetical protein
MPTMADIVVKMADETTNITYNALSPAGGDKSWAEWRQDAGAHTTIGTPVVGRPTFRLMTENNGPRTARRMKAVFKYPYMVQNSTTTRFESTDSIVGDVTLTLPTGVPSNVWAEAVHQYFNLLASALIKSAGKTGYAPQ